MCVIDFIRPAARKRLLAGDVPAWIANNARAPYIASVCLSAPPWAQKQAFRALREERDRLRDETGERYVLDHIVPVNHPLVCGLTVPWNMQVCHWRVNARKGNRFEPDQLCLFE